MFSIRLFVVMVTFALAKDKSGRFDVEHFGCGAAVCPDQMRFTLHDFELVNYQTPNAKAIPFSLSTRLKDLSSSDASEFNLLRLILLGRGREVEEIDSSAFPSLHKNSAVINSIYYTSNALKRPAPMTVGCRVRGHLSIKQLIPTPPLTPSASCGGVTSPQVCSSKRSTVNFTHYCCLFVYLFFGHCGHI